VRSKVCAAAVTGQVPGFDFVSQFIFMVEEKLIVLMFSRGYTDI
jgi:hypothetical protein